VRIYGAHSLTEQRTRRTTFAPIAIATAYCRPTLPVAVLAAAELEVHSECERCSTLPVLPVASSVLDRPQHCITLFALVQSLEHTSQSASVPYSMLNAASQTTGGVAPKSTSVNTAYVCGRRPAYSLTFWLQYFTRG